MQKSVIYAIVAVVISFCIACARLVPLIRTARKNQRAPKESEEEQSDIWDETVQNYLRATSEPENHIG